jgi:hypothetical protein
MENSSKIHKWRAIPTLPKFRTLVKLILGEE